MQEVWESIYSQGQHLNRYPWDSVVSFVYRHAGSEGLKVSDLRILEVGCGAASNLWFAAREGATVIGTDYSQSAIDYARTRFAEEGLQGEFFCCALPELPDIEAGSLDCIIDRGCLCVCDDATVLASHKALARLLKPQGKFLSTFYGTQHSSHLSGEQQSNGLTTGITKGTLSGVGPIAFYDHTKAQKIFSEHWNILELTNITRTVVSSEDPLTHEEWQLVATPASK